MAQCERAAGRRKMTVAGHVHLRRPSAGSGTAQLYELHRVSIVRSQQLPFKRTRASDLSSRKSSKVFWCERGRQLFGLQAPREIRSARGRRKAAVVQLARSQPSSRTLCPYLNPGSDLRRQIVGAELSRSDVLLQALDLAFLQDGQIAVRNREDEARHRCSEQVTRTASRDIAGVPPGSIFPGVIGLARL